MNRQKSSTKLNSRSVDKLKKTIDSAMGRNFEKPLLKPNKLLQNSIPKRSSSTKSLASYSSHVKSNRTQRKTTSAKQSFAIIQQIKPVYNQNSIIRDNPAYEFDWYHSKGLNIQCHNQSGTKGYLNFKIKRQQKEEHIAYITDSKVKIGSKGLNFVVSWNKSKKIGKDEIKTSENLQFNLDKDWKFILISSLNNQSKNMEQFNLKDLCEDIIELMGSNSSTIKSILTILGRKIQLDLIRKNILPKEGYFFLWVSKPIYKSTSYKLADLLKQKLKS